MNARPLRIAVIFLTMIFTALGDEKIRQPAKPELITRVYRLSRSCFLPGDPLLPEKAQGGAQAKRLPSTRDGEIRYDVWDCIVAQGMPAVRGGRAIYLEKGFALIVTTSAEGQELAERLFPGGCEEGFKHAEIAAMLVEFDDDPLAKSVLPHRLLTEIKTLAGESLRVMDAFRIVTKSGQRSFAINKEGATGAVPSKPAASTAKDAPSNETRVELDGARGSLFDIESTIGPDGVTLDVMLRYEGRFKQGEARPDAEFKFTTNLTIPSGQDIIASTTVVHGAPDVPKGKIRTRALFVNARIFQPDTRTAEERRLAEEAYRKMQDDELIRKATEGLGEPSH